MVRWDGMDGPVHTALKPRAFSNGLSRPLKSFQSNHYNETIMIFLTLRCLCICLPNALSQPDGVLHPPNHGPQNKEGRDTRAH